MLERGLKRQSQLCRCCWPRCHGDVAMGSYFETSPSTFREIFLAEYKVCCYIALNFGGKKTYKNSLLVESHRIELYRSRVQSHCI